MNTSTFARLCGVEKRTLFYYDEIGILCPSQKKKNGYREYEVNQLEQMDNIKILQNAGYSLMEIKEIMEAECEKRDQIFTDAAGRLEEKIRKMEAMKEYLVIKQSLYRQYEKIGEDIISEEILLPSMPGKRIEDVHFFSFLQDGIHDIFLIKQDGSLYSCNAGKEKKSRCISFFLEIDSSGEDLAALAREKLGQMKIKDPEIYYFRTIPHLLIGKKGTAIVKIMIEQP